MDTERDEIKLTKSNSTVALESLPDKWPNSASESANAGRGESETNLLDALESALSQNDKLFQLVQGQKAIIKELATHVKILKRKLSGTELYIY